MHKKVRVSILALLMILTACGGKDVEPTENISESPPITIDQEPVKDNRQTSCKWYGYEFEDYTGTGSYASEDGKLFYSPINEPSCYILIEKVFLSDKSFDAILQKCGLRPTKKGTFSTQIDDSLWTFVVVDDETGMLLEYRDATQNFDKDLVDQFVYVLCRTNI